MNNELVLYFKENEKDESFTYYEQFDITWYLGVVLQKPHDFQAVHEYILNRCRNCYIDSEQCKNCCLRKMFERFDKERKFKKYVYHSLRQYGNTVVSIKRLTQEHIEDLKRMGLENARIEISKNGNSILYATQIKDYKYKGE